MPTAAPAHRRSAQMQLKQRKVPRARHQVVEQPALLRPPGELDEPGRVLCRRLLRATPAGPPSKRTPSNAGTRSNRPSITNQYVPFPRGSRTLVDDADMTPALDVHQLAGLGIVVPVGVRDGRLSASRPTSNASTVLPVDPAQLLGAEPQSLRSTVELVIGGRPVAARMSPTSSADRPRTRGRVAPPDRRCRRRSTRRCGSSSSFVMNSTWT